MVENQFNALNIPLNATIKSNGKVFHYFGGTAYLGIPQNEDFLRLYIKGIRLYGLNNGTSRTNNVQLRIYNDAEIYAAQKWGAEAALITSSGFLAAQMTIKNLGAQGEVRYAPATHPALWSDEPPATGGSFDDWSKAIVNEINLSAQKNWVLISNSMNNLKPEIYDFSFLRHIESNKKITLIVDDSHGIGINYNGTSALSALPKQANLSVVLVASMAKALGVDAGIILGPAQLVEQLKKSGEFAGASPPAAAGLYAFLSAEKIYENAFQKLKTNIKLLGNTLKGKPDWEFIPDFPVFFSKNADLSNQLLANQILVSSFPYPDQNGEIVNRIVLSSWHDTEAIQNLIHILP